MRIFVSFASEQEQLAEPVALALRRRGHSVFFSHDDLPPGGNFDERIEKAIADTDILVFLISPESVSKGRYTLTELSFARAKWPDPTNYVLPVMLTETALEKVPNYLKGVTILEPAGNTAAETAAAVGKLGHSKWAIAGFSNWQKLAASFAAATTIIVALTIFLDKIPDFLKKSQTAYTAVNGLFAPSKAASNMAQQSIPSASKESGGSGVLDKNDHGPNELGPQPNPNCHEVTSTDYSTFPPKYSRSWSC